MGFYSGGLGPQDINFRDDAFSVRLVRMVDDSEAIDQIVNRQSSNRKFIRDGQLLILRGDKTYNAIGTQVR